jgi:methionine--tRNA ligase beta chain
MNGVGRPTLLRAVFNRVQAAGKVGRRSFCSVVSAGLQKMDEFGFVSKVLAASQGGQPVDSSATQGLQGPDTRLRALVESCGAKAKAKWLGKASLEEASVAQWLGFKSSLLGEGASSADIGSALNDLNKYLLGKSFLVANAHVTLADVCVFWAVRKHVSEELLSSHPSLLRWFDQLQNWPAIRTSLGNDFPLLKLNLPNAFDTLEVSAVKAGKVTQGKDPATPAAAAAAAPAAPAASAGKKEDKQAAPAQTKEPKKKKQAAPAAAADDQPLATKLDIRVGVFTKCYKHPESDKLLCEEIDVGEDQPRPIASGIYEYYPDPDALVGRKVLVLCNLKPRKIGGYTSNGMVLCAKSSSTVVLVDPPQDAKVGERVVLNGLDPNLPAASPAQVAKNKVFENVAPNLKTDANFVPGWTGPDGTVHSFMTSAGLCKAPGVAGGSVS